VRVEKARIENKRIKEITKDKKPNRNRTWSVQGAATIAAEFQQILL
jgi:hypothetical protein